MTASVYSRKMLGSTPLVSISDKRLGGIEYSSLRYFSAMRALEVSMSRIVNPSFSRKVRRLLPAGSIVRLHRNVSVIIADARFSEMCRASFFEATQLVTISEQTFPRDQPMQKADLAFAGLRVAGEIPSPELPTVVRIS